MKQITYDWRGNHLIMPTLNENVDSRVPFLANLLSCFNPGYVHALGLFWYLRLCLQIQDP